jgi:hypothetical protein
MLTRMALQVLELLAKQNREVGARADGAPAVSIVIGGNIPRQDDGGVHRRLCLRRPPGWPRRPVFPSEVPPLPVPQGTVTLLAVGLPMSILAARGRT